MWCICTMEYYSAITKTKWTQLENIMLNEISQTQKGKKKGRVLQHCCKQSCEIFIPLSKQSLRMLH